MVSNFLWGVEDCGRDRLEVEEWSGVEGEELLGREGCGVAEGGGRVVGGNIGGSSAGGGLAGGGGVTSAVKDEEFCEIICVRREVRLATLLLSVLSSAFIWAFS